MRLVLRDNAPCPDGNGTQIGSAQTFNVFCGSNIEGNTMTIMDLASLAECVEQCAFFHPRCDAVTFSERERCRLKNETRPSDTRPSRFFDSAAGLFPTLPPSDCANGARLSANGGNFNLMCNQGFNGGDLTQVHTNTLNGCMGECSSRADCRGFTFDASMRDGFMNCYLKAQVPQANVFSLTGLDSGTVSAAVQADPAPAPVPSPDPIPSVVIPAPIVPVVPIPASSVVVPVFTPLPAPTAQPVQDPAPLSTTGGAFFTPTILQPITSIQTNTVVSVVTNSASQVVSVTQVVTVPVTTFRPVPNTAQPGAASTSAAAPAPAGEDNLSWVAAPVVGGIAALLVVVVMFIMFRRRRAEATSSWSWKPSFGGFGSLTKGRKLFSRSSSSRDLNSANGSSRRSWGSYWPGRSDAQRLEDGPEEKGRMPVYEVRAGRTQLRGEAGSRPGTASRPSTAGMFRR